MVIHGYSEVRINPPFNPEEAAARVWRWMRAQEAPVPAEGYRHVSVGFELAREESGIVASRWFERREP